MSKCSNVRTPVEKCGKDIPLSKAVVATRWYNLFPLSARKVTVFRHPMGPHGREYDHSYGAGDEEFRLATPTERLQFLLNHKRCIVEEFKVPEAIVHSALMVIPAYRRAMEEGRG